MDEKALYGILISIIGFLVGLVIKLITDINKAHKDRLVLTAKDVNEIALKIELLLERVSSNVDNVSDIKNTLTQFRDDVTTLQLNQRDFISFKADISDSAFEWGKVI